MIYNVNTTTGIPFGVASLNRLADWVWDEFETKGTNVTAEAAFEEWKQANPERADDDDAIQSFWDSFECDECEWTLEVDGMQLSLSWLGGAPLVFVHFSPHTTRARGCSPCVPNAGDLDSQSEDGFVCYSLPVDWFRDRPR